VPDKDELLPFVCDPPPAPTVTAYEARVDNVIALSAEAPPPDVPADVLNPPAPPPPALSIPPPPPPAITRKLADTLVDLPADKTP
jgi:hypothetical protein